MDGRVGLGEQPHGVGRRRIPVGRWFVGVTIVDGAVLVLTGLWLTFRYQPPMPFAPGTDLAQVAHRWSAVGLIGIGIVASGAALVRAVDRRSGAAPIALALGAIVLSAAAWLTGTLLPWDQLALWSVRAGTNITGFSWLWSDDLDVRFVVTQQGFATPETFGRMFLLHLLLGVALVAAALGVSWWRRRASGRSAADT